MNKKTKKQKSKKTKKQKNKKTKIGNNSTFFLFYKPGGCRSLKS